MAYMGNPLAIRQHKVTRPREDVDLITHLQGGAPSQTSRDGAIADSCGNGLLAAEFLKIIYVKTPPSACFQMPVEDGLASIQIPMLCRGDNHLHSVPLILDRIEKQLCCAEDTETEWRPS
ncbi:hypothetical protein IF2G_03178 [Cordyceps javanica]|nr:hypothetical protein IF2G_03178 [Cordyceps javanica]